MHSTRWKCKTPPIPWFLPAVIGGFNTCLYAYVIKMTAILETVAENFTFKNV